MKAAGQTLSYAASQIVISQVIILLNLFQMRQMDFCVQLAFMQTSIIFTFYNIESMGVLRYALFGRILMYRCYLALTSVVLLANAYLLLEIFKTTIIGKRLHVLICVIQKQHIVLSRLLVIYSAVAGVLTFDMRQFFLSVMVILTRIL